MGKKRYIDTGFWNDSFISDLTKEEKYFFLYLILNDKVSIAGVYEIPLKTIAFEADIEKEDVIRMLNKMQSKVHYEDGWIVLRNGIKSQNYRNDKIRRGIIAILESCPQELLQYLTIPRDFEYKVVKKDKQQRLIDVSSMTDDESLHLIKYNTIKSNVIKSDKSQAQDSNKFDPETQTPTQKRNYAIAMKKEREQEKRKRKSFERDKSKPVQIIDVDEIYKRREMR